jgi:hypothetical protein
MITYEYPRRIWFSRIHILIVCNCCGAHDQRLLDPGSIYGFQLFVVGTDVHLRSTSREMGTGPRLQDLPCRSSTTPLSLVSTERALVAVFAVPDDIELETRVRTVVRRFGSASQAYVRGQDRRTMKIFRMSTSQRDRPMERDRLGRVAAVISAAGEFAVAPCSNTRKLECWCQSCDNSTEQNLFSQVRYHRCRYSMVQNRCECYPAV